MLLEEEAKTYWKIIRRDFRWFIYINVGKSNQVEDTGEINKLIWIPRGQGASRRRWCGSVSAWEAWICLLLYIYEWPIWRYLVCSLSQSTLSSFKFNFNFNFNTANAETNYFLRVGPLIRKCNFTSLPHHSAYQWESTLWFAWSLNGFVSPMNNDDEFSHVKIGEMQNTVD